MKITSFTEAFAILRRWQENQRDIMFGAATLPDDEQGMFLGSTGTILSAISESGLVRNSNGKEFDLLGAEFEYDDERSSPLLGKAKAKYEESLTISLPDGEVLFWGAMKDV